VSPLFFSLQKLATFFVIALFTCLLPPSDVDSPVFFINSATKKFSHSGVTPGWCHPGRSAPTSPPVTSLGCVNGDSVHATHFLRKFSNIMASYCFCGLRTVETNTNVSSMKYVYWKTLTWLPVDGTPTILGLGGRTT